MRVVLSIVSIELILSLLIPMCVNAQVAEEWCARYTGETVSAEDHVTAMEVDSAGNVYLAGWSAGLTGDDYVQ